jgi:hypothetical protein
MTYKPGGKWLRTGMSKHSGHRPAVSVITNTSMRTDTRPCDRMGEGSSHTINLGQDVTNCYAAG